jgi:hypothetical protein
MRRKELSGPGILAIDALAAFAFFSVELVCAAPLMALTVRKPESSRTPERQREDFMAWILCMSDIVGKPLVELELSRFRATSD